MTFRFLILKVLWLPTFIGFCYAHDVPNFGVGYRNDESALINSIIDDLLKIRQEEKRTASSKGAEDCEDDAQIDIGYADAVSNAPSRELRHISSQKHHPICHLERQIRSLNSKEYEYRPAFYEEIRCAGSQDHRHSNEVCSSLGFTCVQWNKTIHLTRRRFDSDCWETKTMVIPARCECMWPDQLGDINYRV